MAADATSFILRSPDDTTRFATALAQKAAPGDTLLLSGPVGAGKTHFARSFIQALLRVPEDVPSPTFTLVQSYETKSGPLWHADLYRITSTYEIEELGLTDAFETKICLVEWPDRLGELTPPDALSLTFEHGDRDQERRVTASWSSQRWQGVLLEWAVA